jgi:hypothetical protein
MPNVRTKIPIVEVIAPDGQKSLWVAAVAKGNAVAAVKQARIGVMRALNREHLPALEPRRKRAKRYRVVS